MRTIKRRIKELEKTIGKDGEEISVELVGTVIGADKSVKEKKLGEFKIIRHG